MKPRTLALIGIAITVALSILLMLELKRQHNASAALPVPVFASLGDVQLMLIRGADLVAVSGTGSMRPYIPAGEGIVAYCSIERVSFNQLRKNDLVVYRAGLRNIMHQLAEKEGNAWIATGLHNRTYDGVLVTADNFIGRVVRTYILK